MSSDSGMDYSTITTTIPLDKATTAAFDSMDKTTTAFSNITAVNDEYSGFAYKVLVPAVWVAIILIGTIGNSIVIFTMCRQGRRTMLRSATNCYIINVAVADLAFLVLTVSFTIANYISPEWEFGDTLCKLNIYIIHVTLFATCLTLTAMTIDRYFAIVHPIRSLRTRTPKVAFLICLAIWIASMIACSADLKFYAVVQHPIRGGSITICWHTWPDHWYKVIRGVIVLVTYVVPLTVIVVCYTLILKNLWAHRIGTQRNENHHSESCEPALGAGDTIARRRRKVAKMVAVVVILFAITWLPIQIFTLVFILHDNFPRTKPLYNFKIFAHTLSYANSCMNPFVYTIMGDGFRKAFRESVLSCVGSSRTPQRMGTTSMHFTRRTTTSTTVETGLNGY